MSVAEDKSLLIVEDDRPLRERLARAMEARGFAVTIAESVTEGKARAKDTPPAYAVVDAAISYDFAYVRPDWKGLKAQVNVTNLANHYYVASCFTGLPYCGLGNARTVLGTLKYSWN